MGSEPVNEVEELRRYLGDDRSKLDEKSAQLFDLLQNLYLVHDGKFSQYRGYYHKGWLETMRADIESFKGKTLEALYGKLTLLDIATIFSSTLDEDGEWYVETFSRYNQWRGSRPTYARNHYTAVMEYFATGEGMTIHTIIEAESSPEDFLVKVARKIGGYFTQGATIFEGIPAQGENRLVDLTVTPAMRAMAERIGPAFQHFSKTHYNLS